MSENFSSWDGEIRYLADQKWTPVFIRNFPQETGLIRTGTKLIYGVSIMKWPWLEIIELSSLQGYNGVAIEQINYVYI